MARPVGPVPGPLCQLQGMLVTRELLCYAVLLRTRPGLRSCKCSDVHAGAFSVQPPFPFFSYLSLPYPSFRPPDSKETSRLRRTQSNGTPVIDQATWSWTWCGRLEIELEAIEFKKSVSRQVHSAGRRRLKLKSAKCSFRNRFWEFPSRWRYRTCNGRTCSSACLVSQCVTLSFLAMLCVPRSVLLEELRLGRGLLQHCDLARLGMCLLCVDLHMSLLSMKLLSFSTLSRRSTGCDRERRVHGGVS